MTFEEIVKSAVEQFNFHFINKKNTNGIYSDISNDIQLSASVGCTNVMAETAIIKNSYIERKLSYNITVSKPNNDTTSNNLEIDDLGLRYDNLIEIGYSVLAYITDKHPELLLEISSVQKESGQNNIDAINIYVKITKKFSSLCYVQPAN